MGAKQIGGGIVVFDVNNTVVGGGQNTANGISGDGSAGTPIILGGVLTGNTTISGHFQFAVVLTTVPQTSEVIITPNGASILSLITGTTERAVFNTSNQGATRANFSVTYEDSAAHLQTINSKRAPNNTAVKGISIGDTVDNIGLIGEVLFTNSDPKQYAQYGNLGSLTVGSINLRAQTTTQTVTLYAVPAGTDKLLRINPFLQITGLGATTNIQMDLLYTDESGNAQTVNLINTGVLNPDNTLSPAIIYAQKSTNVQLRVTLNIPGAGYNVYAICEYLGIQN